MITPAAKIIQEDTAISPVGTVSAALATAGQAAERSPAKAGNLLVRLKILRLFRFPGMPKANTERTRDFNDFSLATPARGETAPCQS